MRKGMLALCNLVLIGLSSWLFLAFSDALGDASQLFDDRKRLVYQIRIIDISSGDKSSIGSGFQVSADGVLATNYHVVSDLIHEQDRHRLEVIDYLGNTIQSSLLDFDVVHDIALIKISTHGSDFFRIGKKPLSKGQRIYSIGNPQDLGMTIIEGNYNGLVENSRHKRLLFSGSLNPGMSGGPAIDEGGDVVGINVSKGGEQISFLVPSKLLSIRIEGLREHASDADYAKLIQKDLYRDQDQYFKRILEATVPSESFGELLLPGKLDPSLKCWGHTVDKPKLLYDSFHKHCRTEDNLFIDGEFTTGSFAYNYEWISTEKLNRLQFYHAVESRFKHLSLYNLEKEKYATNLSCTTDFVTINQESWKASICFRKYKQYHSLYDATLLLASVGQNHQAAVVTSAATGISKENAMALFRMFMGAIKWKRS
jgi:serine protease Do